MITLCKFLAVVFLALCLGSIGHDVWRSYNTEREFSFSEVGGLFQLYAKEQHDAFREFVVEQSGVSTFNSFIVPILSLHTAILTGALAGLFFGLMQLIKFKNSNGAQNSKTLKFKRR